jgi:hypothetical protein
VYLSRRAVAGVGVVHACGAHIVALLAVPGCRVGQVDDVEDVPAAEAGLLRLACRWPYGAEPLALRPLTPSGRRRSRLHTREPGSCLMTR